MEKVFKRAAHGNKKAQAELYNQLSPKIYNLAFYTLYSHEDAQDITQETLARLIKTLEEGRVSSNPLAYAYSIARNLCMDQLKQGEKIVFDSKEVLKEIHDPYLFSNPEKASLLQEQMDTTVQAALALSPSQRMALNLRELQEMSYEQIGEIMGLNRNAVAALLFRSRRKFKEVFRMAQIKDKGEGELCQDISMLLSAYIDNELDEESRCLVEEHLEDCPLCRLSLEEMEEASVSYRSLIPLAPIALAQAGLLMRLFSFLSRLLPGMAGAKQLVPGVQLLSRGAEVGYGTFRAAVAAATAVVLVSGAGGVATITANEDASPSSAVVEDARSEVVVGIEDYNVYLSELESGETWQLTNDGLNSYPSISPDGETIAFTSYRPFVEELMAGSKGESERYSTVFIMNPDGSHRRALTDPSMGSCYHPSFTPDGRYLVYAVEGPNTEVERDGYITFKRDVAICLYDLEEGIISKQWRHTQWRVEGDIRIFYPQYLAEEDVFVFDYGGSQHDDLRLRKATPGVEGHESFWDYEYREYISPSLSPDGSLLAGIEQWTEHNYIEDEGVDYAVDHEYAVLFDTQGNPQRGRSICLDPSDPEMDYARISWMDEEKTAVYSRTVPVLKERNLLIDFESGEVVPLSIEGYSLGGGRADLSGDAFTSSYELYPQGEEDLSNFIWPNDSDRRPAEPNPDDPSRLSFFLRSHLARGVTLSKDGKTAIAIMSTEPDRYNPARTSLVKASLGAQGDVYEEILCDLGEITMRSTLADMEWWEEEGYVAIVTDDSYGSDIYVVDLEADDIRPALRAENACFPSWARWEGVVNVFCYETQGRIFIMPPMVGTASCIELSGSDPAITLDGRSLAFVRTSGGISKVILKDLETSEKVVLYESENHIRDLSWDSTGTNLLFVEDWESQTVEAGTNGYDVVSTLYLIDTTSLVLKPLLSYEHFSQWSRSWTAICRPRFLGDSQLIYFCGKISGGVYALDLITFDPEGKKWWFLIPGYEDIRDYTRDFIVY